MKRTLLCILSLLMTIIIKAGDVTPEVAMKQAADFVKQRVANGSRRAPSASQLTMAKKVSGLYVINIGKSEGFVIVSPDDRTDAILGFADQGSFDVNNIPENMKAWLEGYADEIAWAKQNNVTSSVSSNRAAKTSIAPLMQTKWDQQEPFNDNCPEYTTGKKAPTGCVATATAQTMFFNQWPASIANTIPKYTWNTIDIGPFAAGTGIDWANMQLSYSGSESDAQKASVANLMEYLDCALKMGYGSTSSAYTSDVPAVLKNYFDYDATVEYIERPSYSYANWINIIYHELSNNRIVIYNGRNARVGHAFICDGYQGEDYFHFNWGWGGKSDGYYKLSAVNPKDLGTGGGSSTSGYALGQGAVVGIQKNGAGGTVSALVSQKNENNLTVNSIAPTVATSVAKDASIDISFNITNNGAKDFDGDIALRIQNVSTEASTVGDAKYFYIKAGETKDCVIPFAPVNINTGDYKIRLTKLNGNGEGVYTAFGGETATITVTAATGTEGTDNVDLTIEPTVANATYTGTYGSEGIKYEYDLLGNNLNATVTMTNSTSNDYKGELLWKVVASDFSGSFTYESIPVTVPKNSHIDVPIVVNDLDKSKTYHRLCLNYVKNGSSVTQQNYRYYLQPAIVTYKADGTFDVVAPTTTYEVPATALSVDLAGAGVTTVTKNSNPNCLYILKSTDDVPAGLTNVIKQTGTNYTADLITLTDGNNFQSPVDFTATKIEFIYNNNRSADGTNGWNTLVLPFDVTKVTANDTEIDWFHSNSDTGKQFWVKEFVSDAVGQVNFGFANAMKANTPYIIALPGDHWGSAYDLSSKTIKFVGQNVTISQDQKTVVTADNYRFVGNTVTSSVTKVYCINDAGNKFVDTTGSSSAFRAYFKPDIYDAAVGSLSIGTDDTVITGIKDIKKGTDDNVYYDLQGRRVLYPKKGLFIVNGKKVIVK